MAIAHFSEQCSDELTFTGFIILNWFSLIFPPVCFTSSLRTSWELSSNSRNSVMSSSDASLVVILNYNYYKRLCLCVRESRPVIITMNQPGQWHWIKYLNTYSQGSGPAQGQHEKKTLQKPCRVVVLWPQNRMSSDQNFLWTSIKIQMSWGQENILVF